LKYSFSFKEINYGSIEIESDHEPDNGDVIDAIMNGGAYYDNTEYEDISRTGDKALNMGANDKGEKEAVQDYVILRSIAFENNQGFALACDLDAPDPFVTWQFTEDESGKRDYYWGHYAINKERATMDYEHRISVFMRDYGISEKDAYKYYSTQRPVDIATYPETDNGPVHFVNFDKREAVESGRMLAWGYLIYDAPLTDKQISDYELRAAPDNPDMKKRIHEQTQTVGIWEDENRVPDNKRYTWHKPSIQGFALREPAVTPEQLEQRYAYAFRELTAAAERRNAPKPIAEQLAEAAKLVERNESVKSDKKQNRDER